MLSEQSENQKFADIKISVEETRIRASDYFSMKKYDKAIKLYRRILQTVGLASTSDEAEMEQQNDLLSRIHTNIAVCFNKTEDGHSNTLQHIHELELLGSIDKNPKALYAKGRALIKLGVYTEAKEALVKALKLRPMDEQIINAIKELKQRETALDEFNKTFAKNLKLA